MRKVRLFTLAFLVVAISACVLEPNYEAQAIRPAYPPMVVDCTFLGEVTGKAAWSYLPASRNIAKHRALEEAANIGATHIVWVEINNELTPYAKGRVYYCDPNKN